MESRARPSCMPGPRSPPSDVRLALSKEPLKTIFSSGCFRPILSNVSAAARQTFSFSSEHGPASRSSFLESKSMGNLRINHVWSLLLLQLDGRGDEGRKERMRLVGLGMELGVTLHAEE